MTPEKIEEIPSPSVWPAVKMGALVLGIGLAALLFLVTSSLIVTSLAGTFLAVVWFILLLIIFICSAMAGYGKYESMLPKNNSRRYY